MSSQSTFCPHYGSGQVVTPAVAAATISIDPTDKSVLLTNSGAAICYVKISNDSTAAATTADCPILSGQQITISKGEPSGFLSHISAAGTTLHVMTGEGFK